MVGGGNRVVDCIAWAGKMVGAAWCPMMIENMGKRAGERLEILCVGAERACA